MCAAYDDSIGSGYVDRLPGIGAFNPRSMTAPGSDGHSYGQEAAAASVVVGRNTTVSTPYRSSQVDQAHVDITAGDSNVPGQVPENEPFTQVGNTWRETVGHDDPSGHVATPHHPNAL